MGYSFLIVIGAIAFDQTVQLGAFLNLLFVVVDRVNFPFSSPKVVSLEYLKLPTMSYILSSPFIFPA